MGCGKVEKKGSERVLKSGEEGKGSSKMAECVKKKKKEALGGLEACELCGFTAAFRFIFSNALVCASATATTQRLL